MAENVQRNIVVKLKSDDTSLQKGLRASATSVKAFGRQLGNLKLGVLGLGAGIAGLVGGAGLVALGRSLAGNIDSQAKLAQRLTTSVGVIQEFKLAAALTGTDLGVMERAAVRLSQTLGKQLISPSKEVRDALNEIGVSAKAFAGAGPAQVFKELVPLVAGISDPLKQAAVGSALFGRAWNQLVPLMSDSENVFGVTNALLNETGLAMTNLEAQGVERLNDSMTKLTTLGQALAEKTFAKLAPTLNEIVNTLGQGAIEFIEMSGGAEKLASTISDKLLGAFVDLANDAPEALERLSAGLGFLGDALGFAFDALEFAGTAGAGLAAAGVQAAQGNFSGAGAALDAMADDLAEQTGLQDRELSEQTRLLQAIVDKPSGAVAG